MTFKPIHPALVAIAITALVGGCATSSPYLDTHSSAARAEFEECRDRGLAIQASATSSRSEAMYLRAADVMASCLNGLSGGWPVSTSERMRLGALVALAQIKGGDTDAARITLAELEASNPDRDLYLTDSVSVIDSLHLLLDEVPSDASDGGILNVSATLSAEMKRINYWQTH